MFNSQQMENFYKLLKTESLPWLYGVAYGKKLRKREREKERKK